MDRRDCIYPDCLIRVGPFGRSCENSCEYEVEKWAERLANDLVAAGESEYASKPKSK